MIKKTIKNVGLDVHKNFISISIADDEIIEAIKNENNRKDMWRIILAWITLFPGALGNRKAA